MLIQVFAETWEPPSNGISPDLYETVAAVLWCATRATSLRDELLSAVQLGGDTETLSAPLVASGDGLGALNIYRRQPGGFSADEETLVSFASYASVALANARR